jgi:hypothetical protein
MSLYSSSLRTRAWRDTVANQVYAPLEPRSDERVLVELAVAPFEPLAAVGIAQQAQVGPGGRGCWPGSPQCWVGIHRAVTVDTGDLNGLGHLAVEIAIAVVVLGKVAVHTLHTLVHVDGGQVHGLEFIKFFNNIIYLKIENFSSKEYKSTGNCI